MSLMLIFMLSAHASNNLYQTEVIIDQASRSEQQEMVEKAYRQILVKVTGNREILSSPIVKQQAPKAKEMVTQFHYMNADNGTRRKVAVYFEPAKIQEILIAADQEIWGGARPILVLWLVENDPKSEYIYTEENSPKVAALVNQIDIERGLTLTLPLLDLEDMSKISAENIRQLDLDKINTASNRYDSSLQLIGLIGRDFSKQQVIIDWYLVQDFSRRHYESSADNFPNALANGLNEGIDIVARRYIHRAASHKDQAAQVTLSVYGINDINSYAQLSDYLRNIERVQQVNVKHIGQDKVMLQISVEGGRKAFIDILAEDNKLRPLEKSGALDARNLRYQLMT